MWLRNTEAYVQIATEAFDEGLWRLPSEAIEDAMNAYDIPSALPFMSGLLGRQIRL